MITIAINDQAQLVECKANLQQIIT
ncbi:thiamine biosynthesis protein ThiS, partial [Vibrio parahaemolyticus]